MSNYYVNETEVIEIGHDFFADNPRNKDDFSTFITTFDNYESPDETEFTTFYEIEQYFGMQYTGTTENYLEKLCKNADKKGYFLIPVYCIDKDELNYTTKKTSDSILTGVIYTTKKKIYEEYNVTRLTPKIKKTVRDRFEHECRQYSLYINDYCYYVSVYDLDTFEQIEYCGDLLGKDIHEAGIYETSNLRNAKYIGEFSNLDEFRENFDKFELKRKFKEIRKDECWFTDYISESDWCSTSFKKFETIPTIDEAINRYNDFRQDVISELEENYNSYKTGDINLLWFLECASALCRVYKETVSDIEFICNDFKY